VGARAAPARARACGASWQQARRAVASRALVPVLTARSAVGRHVRSAEDMNMLPTAAFFGEKIVCLPGAKDSGAPAPRPRPSALTHASNPHPAPGALRCALTQAVLCGADVYKLAHIYYKQRHFKRALQVPVCVGWWPRARLLGPFPHGTALPRRNYCELACRQEAA